MVRERKGGAHRERTRDTDIAETEEVGEEEGVRETGVGVLETVIERQRPRLAEGQSGAGVSERGRGRERQRLGGGTEG